MLSGRIGSGALRVDARILVDQSGGISIDVGRLLVHTAESYAEGLERASR